jgi:hypothetical protein
MIKKIYCAIKKGTAAWVQSLAKISLAITDGLVNSKKREIERERDAPHYEQCFTLFLSFPFITPKYTKGIPLL